MPVTPPIEQEFKNVHKYVEESEIHPPLGYRDGDFDTVPSKTIHGELVWQPKLYQAPVIGFLNLGSTVSPNDGDRYIATGIGSTGDYADAVANDIIGYLTIDSYGQTYNQWDKASPVEGMLVYVSSLDEFYYYNGSSWATLSGASGFDLQAAIDALLVSPGYVDIGNERRTATYVLKKTSSMDFEGANSIGIRKEITLDTGNIEAYTKILDGNNDDMGNFSPEPISTY